MEVKIEQQSTGKSESAIASGLSGSNVFGHLAYLQQDLPVPEFDGSDKVYAKWWSRYTHLMLIRLTLANLVTANPVEQLAVYYKNNEQVLNELIQSRPSEVIKRVEGFFDGEVATALHEAGSE